VVVAVEELVVHLLDHQVVQAVVVLQEIQDQ
jgi:hypothetical protein